ncbi:MAG: hypothetical protein FWG42_03500 [Clostridiales bacterium]|nr:hypothetical protein [Clostridiales bacterium]
MKPRHKFLSVLLALVLLLPASSGFAAFTDEPFEADVTATDVVETEQEATASSAAVAGSWTVELEDWKIAPEGAISIAPWKAAGAGDASAPTVSTANWIPAKVPGTVLGNLLDAGVYDDVFVPNNEGERDVYFDGNMQHIPRDDFAGWWWYSIDFNVGADQVDNFFNLNLKNMSYQGEVYVNGTQLFNENTNIKDVKEVMNKESVDRATYPEYTAGSNPPPPFVYNTNNIGLTQALSETATNTNFGRPVGSGYLSQSDGNENESGGKLSSVAQFGHGDFDKYKNLFIGAFRTYDINITDLVKPGVNTIRIKVKRMFNVADFGPFWHDWHPTTSDNNMGLTGAASLDITGAVRLANPMAAAKVIEGTVTPGGNGDAALSLYVNASNMTNAPVTALLSGVVKGPDGVPIPNGTFSNVSATMPAKAYNWDIPLFEDFLIPNAQLWWTNGAGGQPLYTVDYTITVDGVVSDTLTHRFGIRELRHEINNTNSSGTIGLQVFINHQPVVMKGGGFGALDHFYRMDDLANKNFVEIVKTMGHNMWRDEGKFFSEKLYDLMDEAGLLLMTGFMCCDRNEVAAQGFSSAERMIIYESVYSQMRILRSHAAGWAFLNGSDRTKSNGATAANPSGANIERKMWEIAGRVRWFQIGNTLAAATSGASVLSGAGSGLTMGGGYETVPPGKFYQGLSPTDNSTGAYGGLIGFYSETAGGMGIPTLETLKKVLPEENWWPYNKGNGGALGAGPGNYNHWNYLNARGGCFESLDVSNLYVESAFGPSNTIDEYNIRAQLFQYDQQRAIHEALHVTRFSKGTGFVNWMLNSPRPSTFWNQFDFYLHPIGNSFGSAKGNTPVHVAYDQFSRKAFAMNNTREAVNGATATLKVYDIYGDQINETLKKTFNLPADGVTSWSGTTIDRLTGFVPNQRNGDDWFEGSFEPFYTQYSTANAAGRRAAGASGNLDLWSNADIVGSLIKPTTDVYFVSLELRDKDGGLFSRNDYAVARKREVISTQSSAGRAMSQAADLTQVNMLPKVDLTVQRNPGGFRAGDKSMWEQTVTITNPTGDIAFGIEMKAYTDSTKANMTPVNYDDNLITLYPGESRTITIWHFADNLGGKDAYIGVDCYNNIISGEERNLSRGNNYVPGDPDSDEWAAWGLAPQTQTSRTTNLARNVGSSVATVASNATGPNTMATNTGNAPTRITNATFVTFANERANSVLDSIMADGATSSTTGYAQIPVGSAHYTNLGSAQTFDKVISRWNENSYQEWNPCLVGRGVPDRVRLQISAATGETADWNNLLYDETYDNTKSRSYIVEILLDKAYTARHIRLIPDGVTGASDPYGVQNASGRLLRGAGYGRDSGWDPTSGRLNDQVVLRARLDRFSLTSVEIYHTFNHVNVEFIGGDGLKATVNGKTILTGDAPVKKTAYAFYGDKINIELDERLFVYLDMVDVNDKVVAAGDKYTLELDAIDAPAVLTISDTPITTIALNTDLVSYINNDACYTVSLAGAVDVLAVELEFIIDGSMLAGKGLEGLNGFDAMNNILWTFAGDNNWKGTVTLALPSGTTTGLTSAAPVDIAKFTYTPKGFGNAAMAITSARLVFLNGTTKFVGSFIENGKATTIIARSKYDLNRDGVVDALDLGIMLLYCGFDADSPDWAVFVKVNDAWGNPVTASMCDVNSDGLIDMLDLLDLFIHYTK